MLTFKEVRQQHYPKEHAVHSHENDHFQPSLQREIKQGAVTAARCIFLDEVPPMLKKCSKISIFVFPS